MKPIFWFCFLMFLAGAIIPTYILCQYFASVQRFDRLVHQGQVITGTVTFKKYYSKPNNKTGPKGQYMIEYRFKSPDNHWHMKRTGIREKAASKLIVDGPVDVYYLNDNTKVDFTLTSANPRNTGLVIGMLIWLTPSLLMLCFTTYSGYMVRTSRWTEADVLRKLGKRKRVKRIN